MTYNLSMGKADLSGEWESTYFYGDGKSSRHLLALQPDGTEWFGTATGKDGSKLSIALHFKPDDRTLTGTWQEVTSAEGAYEGAVFYGGVQFILNKSRAQAEGAWVGFNSAKDKINTGRWILTRAHYNRTDPPG
jgi:hypothetical protein